MQRRQRLATDREATGGLRCTETLSTESGFISCSILLFYVSRLSMVFLLSPLAPSRTPPFSMPVPCALALGFPRGVHKLPQLKMFKRERRGNRVCLEK
eukprot:scaffold20439_cov136-Isochrysis_galbana.AAC.7